MNEVFVWAKYDGEITDELIEGLTVIHDINDELLIYCELKDDYLIPVASENMYLITELQEIEL